MLGDTPEEKPLPPDRPALSATLSSVQSLARRHYQLLRKVRTVNQATPSVTPAAPTVFADGQPSFADRLGEANLGDWAITGRLESADADPNLSGGFFSVGYAVKHKQNGTDAFLKAFDLKRVLSQQSGMS
jgi:hypothetical protein